MRRAVTRIVVGLVGAVVLLTGATMCERVTTRGRQAAPLSTFGAGPEGTRALYLALEELGLRPQRLTHDLPTLPADAMLVVLGACDDAGRHPVNRLDERELERFVRAGGVLLVGGVPDVVPRALGVEIVREQKCVAKEDAPVETFVAREGPLAGISGTLRQPATLRAEGPHEVLLGGDPPRALVTRHGKGAVVALASSSLFDNGHLIAAGGARVLVRLRDALGVRGAIVFDELHLGVGAPRSLMMYLRELGAGPLLAQLFVAALLALWRVGARVAPPRASTETLAALGSDRYVEALGGLYARANDRSGVAELLRQDALEAVARHHRAARPDEAALRARLGAKLTGAEDTALGVLLYPADKIDSDRALLARARAIDAAREALVGQRNAGLGKQR